MSSKKLVPVDSLIVDVIMDNVSDNYSSKPAHVSSEFANVISAGACELSGETLCCAQLGLSLLLTVSANGTQHKLLFDAGPEGDIFIRNAKTLGIDLSTVEEIAISHGHWDHMGALLHALDASATSDKKIRVHVNPGMFVERGVKLGDGRVVPFAKVPSADELASHNALLVNDAADRTLLDDCFYLSGEIPRVSSFEKGRVDHLCRTSPYAEWNPDPLLLDERYVAVNVKDKGLIVFSSCSHAGIINVLTDLKTTFSDIPIYCVFGGFHLVSALEKIIPQTVEAMKEFELKQIVPAHCTGWRAVFAMVNEFGEDIVVPSAVGSRYTF